MREHHTGGKWKQRFSSEQDSHLVAKEVWGTIWWRNKNTRLKKKRGVKNIQREKRSEVRIKMRRQFVIG